MNFHDSEYSCSRKLLGTSLRVSLCAAPHPASHQRTHGHFDLEMKLPFMKAKTLIHFSQSLFYPLKSNGLAALLEKRSTLHILIRANTDPTWISKGGEFQYQDWLKPLT